MLFHFLTKIQVSNSLLQLLIVLVRQYIKVDAKINFFFDIADLNLPSYKQLGIPKLRLWFNAADQNCIQVQN